MTQIDIIIQVARSFIPDDRILLCGKEFLSAVAHPITQERLCHFFEIPRANMYACFFFALYRALYCDCTVSHCIVLCLKLYPCSFSSHLPDLRTVTKVGTIETFRSLIHNAALTGLCKTRLKTFGL